MSNGVEFGPNVGEGWRPSIPQWERNVECPAGCGYMAVEFWKRGAITGVCTKCGHCWGSSRPDREAVRRAEPTTGEVEALTVEDILDALEKESAMGLHPGDENGIRHTIFRVRAALRGRGGGV